VWWTRVETTSSGCISLLRWRLRGLPIAAARLPQESPGNSRGSAERCAAGACESDGEAPRQPHHATLLDDEARIRPLEHGGVHEHRTVVLGRRFLVGVRALHEGHRGRRGGDAEPGFAAVHVEAEAPQAGDRAHSRVEEDVEGEQPLRGGDARLVDALHVAELGDQVLAARALLHAGPGPALLANHDAPGISAGGI